MRIKLDLGRCAGYGNCVEPAPEVFRMKDDEDVAELLMEDIPADLADKVRKAARVCPAAAIIIEE